MVHPYKQYIFYCYPFYYSRIKISGLDRSDNNNICNFFEFFRISSYRGFKPLIFIKLSFLSMVASSHGTIDITSN